MRHSTMRLAAFLGLLCLPLLVACPDDAKYRLPTEVVPTDGSLKLDTAGGVTTLPADGVSTLEIVARIAPEALKDDRKITFTTTAGSFLGAASAMTTIDAVPDASGTARVLLRSSTEIGLVLVTAQVKDGTTLVGSAERMAIEFVRPDMAPVALSTVGGATSLPADGVSTLEFRAQISAADATRGRKVTFSTTAGTLVGASGAAAPLDVTPNANGTAHALLRSSTVVGTAIVAAQLKDGSTNIGAADTVHVEFVQPDATEIIRFVEAASTAPADGATASRFTVRISDSLPVDRRTVMFRTTAGSFSATNATQVTDSAMAGSDGLASVLLYSPKRIGAARVTAEVAGFEATTEIDFTVATVERIFVTIDQFKLEQDDSAVVEVTLTRRVGTPSEGTVVVPAAEDVTRTAFGVFTGLPRSNEQGKVTLEFHPDGGGTPGRARIRVVAEGSSAVGEVEFELVAPEED